MENDTTQPPEDADSEQPTNPVGRPLAFKTVEELDGAIETYLGNCSPHKSKQSVLMDKADGTTYWAMVEYMTKQEPVTVAGAAYALGINRRTLLDYKERSEFLPSIERLLAACEAYTESMLYSNAANGAKFSLANNFKGSYQPWSERQEVDHTTNGKDMNPYKELTTEDLRKLAEEPDHDGDTATSQD